MATVMSGKKFPYPFLPVSRADLEARGWDQCDIVIVSGDAYVDHPAFGPPLIARFLEGRGFKVGLIAQPDWHSAEPFKELGKPRLFFGVAAGNMDSMLNRLTAQKKNRSEDQYSPGGRTGCRPDRATIVYAQRCREACPDVPVVLGGIEASLRRIAHYDYWSDKLRKSILLDAKADLLVFGMGERPIWEIADRLNRGEKVGQLRDVRGTAYLINNEETKRLESDPAVKVSDRKMVVLPSFEAVAADPTAFARMTGAFQRETNPGNGRPLLQRHGERGVYFNAPAFPLGSGEGDTAQGLTNVAMDELYDLPFNRAPHPMYGERQRPRVRDRQALGGADARLLRRLLLLLDHRARGAGDPEPLRGQRAPGDPRACAAWATSAAPSPTSAAPPPTCTSSSASRRRSSRSAASSPACTRASARTSAPITVR